MSDLETAVRAALNRRLRLSRLPDVPAWNDEAVEAIMAAAGHPDGMITADGPEAAAVLAAMRERAERAGALRGLAAEILAAFAKGPDGYRARASQAKISEWSERLGEDAPS